MLFMSAARIPQAASFFVAYLFVFKLSEEAKLYAPF